MRLGTTFGEDRVQISTLADGAKMIKRGWNGLGVMLTASVYNDPIVAPLLSGSALAPVSLLFGLQMWIVADEGTYWRRGFWVRTRPQYIQEPSKGTEVYKQEKMLEH